MSLRNHIGSQFLQSMSRTAPWSMAIMSLAMLIGGMTPVFTQAQSTQDSDQLQSTQDTDQALTLQNTDPAQLQQNNDNDQSPQDSTNQGAVPMDKLSLANPQPKENVVPTAEQPKNNPFISDSKFSLQARSFFFYRQNFDTSLAEAWAVGGWVSYKSGYLANIFAIGAVGYGSMPVYAPGDRDGTGLLQNGQDAYAKLGQAYGEVKFTDRIFGAVGAKEYNTPYINKNDTRMTPNTFEGATFYGTAGGKENGADGVPEWRFGGGYIAKIEGRTSTGFEWMSQEAGSDANRGVFLGGANVDAKRWSLGAIDYYSADIINIFYAEGKYSLLKGDTYELKLSGQVSDERSTGENRLAGDDFANSQFGVKADFTLGDAILTVGYTNNTGSDDMRSPWGGYPGYTSVQVQDFFRAGEQALMFRAGYDFTNLGLKQVSAYGLWVHGYGVDGPDESNQDEFDANLQWAPKDGWMRGTSYRIRYAYVLQNGGGDPNLEDFRFIINYDFPNQ